MQVFLEVTVCPGAVLDLSACCCKGYSAVSGFLQAGGLLSALFMRFIAVSHGQKGEEPRSAPESKALRPGLLSPRERSRLPNLLSSLAASSASSDCRSWRMWVPIFSGWEGTETCSPPSQWVISYKVFVQTVLRSLFCQSLACGGRRGKFHHEIVLLPVPSFTSY